MNAASRVTLTWINTRGIHLLNSLNINAPVAGVYPFGDPSLRLLTEDAGMSRINQLVSGANINYRKLFLFRLYTLSWGADNNEGLPADPYNLRAEWGPSAYGDVRQRLVTGTTVPLPLKIIVNPFLVANSGVPYNITTGLDPLLTGFPAQRPALVDLPAPACLGTSLVYAAKFGCFNLTPRGGMQIGRNYGRGPAAVNLILRVSRTWAFGGGGESGPRDQATHQGGGMNGPPAGMFAPNTGRRYNVTLSASTMNALNRANFAPPNGNLASPYFGEARSLGGLIVMSHGGGASTYNRKIDLQLRLTF